MHRRKQCAKCPWKVSTDPDAIPDGYSRERHAGLYRTIATKADWPTAGNLHIMACHETPVSREVACVGWLHNQLGPGNNIPLRLSVIAGRTDGHYELDGPQHKTFEETLPK